MCVHDDLRGSSAVIAANAFGASKSSVRCLEVKQRPVHTLPAGLLLWLGARWFYRPGLCLAARELVHIQTSDLCYRPGKSG
jgi:hypothetical protein